MPIFEENSGVGIARSSSVSGASEFTALINPTMRTNATATLIGTPNLRAVTSLGSGTGNAFIDGSFNLNTSGVSVTGKVLRVRGTSGFSDSTAFAIFCDGAGGNVKLDAEL